MQTKDEIKTETKDTPIEAAIKDADKAEKEFDKDRQRADQAEANFRKAKAERDKLNSELESQRQKAQELEAQIKELQAGKAAEKDVADLIPEIDPENASVEDYGKAMRQMRVVIANLNKKLAQVETKGDQSEAARKKEREIAAEQEQRNKTFNKVCDRLEKKHGPGLRNRAIELMEQRVATEGDPENQAEATLMLDDCFAEAKTEAAKKPKDKKVVTDTGGGGRVSFGNVQIKKGSLDEVFEQFERASKTG
jgi:chromosome segregation ATPase